MSGIPTVRTWDDIQFIVDQLNSRIKRGTDTDPNGKLSGRPGDLYVSLSGGTGSTLWVKESGLNTRTGWVAK
jgi:hypothetical protein